MLLDIATGTSRRQKRWKNEKIDWNELVLKLQKTHRTAETFAQYMAAAKPRQAEIKDIGCFVGGYLNDGRRGKGTVRHRQLITLDADFAESNTWDAFSIGYDIEALVYSTHKHSPDSPRLRFIIPLNRPVSPEEYQAISRRIADDIGMELFDSTTFQPERLMYWPSTAADAEYYFRYQHGPILDADEVLATYVDWRDISAWPMAEKESISTTAIKKQGAPTEKPGLVGSFCRAYDIEAAINEFLPDLYEEAGEGRLTYKEGTTAAGVVLYEDGQFLYSHHHTDPAGGKLLNAFDLVRIHKYGDLDEDDTLPINKRPSYKEMCAFARDLPAVKREANVSIEEDFGPVEESDKDWFELMELNDSGKPKPTIDNIEIILQNDPRIAGAIQYNDFENQIFITKTVSWKKITEPAIFTDADDAKVRKLLEKSYDITAVGKTMDAIMNVAYDNMYHPVRDYLNTLSWDGVPRIERVLIDYLGAEDNKYTRTVTKKTLVAAVARIFEPGIKFDYILTLVGKQGLRKSTLFRKLGGDWFSDSFTTVQGKEAYEQLQGNWIIEMAELAGLKKAEVETVKHFVSKQVDNFRAAYARRVARCKRQSIFVGTTNEWSFLKDHTGNRRFWPVGITGAGNDKIADMPVDQIWAEAKYYYKEGEALWLEDASIERMAEDVQGEHFEVDDRTGAIMDYLDMLLPDHWNDLAPIYRRQYVQHLESTQDPGIHVRQYVCVAEIWMECLGEDKKTMSTQNTKYIHQIMNNMPGWRKSKIVKYFRYYGRQRTYERITDHITDNGETLRSKTQKADQA